MEKIEQLDLTVETSTQQQLDDLKIEIERIKRENAKNNFSAHQDFNKTSKFTTKLIVPHFDRLPSSCEKGEIGEYGGDLYICSRTNRWEKVGGQ